MCPPPKTTEANQSHASALSYKSTFDICSDFIPADDLCKGAYELARSVLPRAVLNHSVRVYLFAKWLAQCEHSEWTTSSRLPLLFVACVLHDVGCTPDFDGPQRFEVEGADAAADYLRKHDVPETDVHEVWQAIALHSSPGIAERISSLARLVRQGVLIDFSRQADIVNGELRRTVEQSFPRLGIEKELGDAVVDQAMRRPEKAPPASWPGILLRAKRESPDWDGVNKAF